MYHLLRSLSETEQIKIINFFKHNKNEDDDLDIIVSKLIKNLHVYVKMIKEKSEIVSCVVYSLNNEMMDIYVYCLASKVTERKQGHGTELMRSIEKSHPNVRTIRYKSRQHNIGMKKVADKLQYLNVGTEPGMDDLVRYKKTKRSSIFCFCS